MSEHTLIAHAQELLDANRYVTIGTADRDGRPWTTPVFFAPAPGWRFYWVSDVGARHSRNLVDRPAVSLVVFDSTVAPYHGRAVYAVGDAHQLTDDEVDEGLQAYPGPSRPEGRAITRDDVTDSSEYRLFRVSAAQAWVLCPRAPREPCPLHGQARDHRVRVH